MPGEKPVAQASPGGASKQSSSVEDEIADLRRQLAAMSTMQNPPASQVVIQRERKLRKFRDVATSGDVAAWCLEAEDPVAAQGLTGTAALKYVLYALEGPARLELRCRESVKTAGEV